MVNKARLVESMANLVKDKRIDGITNIQDHSSREGMQIVVDVRRDANAQVILNVQEIKNPDLDAQLVAENIAAQLENRVSFRRAMKKCLQSSMRAGAKGIKTSVAGRLGGADIARSEGYHEGSIPLQTLRADIDYGFAEAKTAYGRLGVKVWIYKGQVLPTVKKAPAKTEGGK